MSITIPMLGLERKIDDNDTAIGFRYNKSMPSSVLDMTLNAPDMYGEYDFSLSFSYPNPTVSRRVHGPTVAKRDFYVRTHMLWK
jgi:hypothetical protein